MAHVENEQAPSMKIGGQSTATALEPVEVVERAAPADDGRMFARFPVKTRLLHACMVVSFLSLALTGMTLKFSYTGWAFRVAHFLGGFEAAGYIHRAAAIVMFCTFVTHLVDLFLLKKNKYGTWKALIFGPNTMIPNGQDFREFIATMKWFLRMGPRPEYGRWTYWEKFDYFAVFWGIFIIGSTGLTLWFPVFFTRLMPGWFINVATIIHSDEALLATGFIFTVHFFNTHLRPEKFPMDTSIFTGHVPLAELKRDKPREYATLLASGELESRMEPPHQDVVVKVIRGFAWTALTLGFSIIVAIIYAMVFAYR